jgi:hypothetical protein
MKHCVRTLGNRFTLVAVAVSLTVLFTGGTASAQQGKYVTQAATRIGQLVDTANGAGYKLYDNTFSIGGGWLKQSASTWVALYTITMEEGKQYRVVAAGDDDATDVDVEIQLNGATKKADTSTAPTATVDFTPSESGRYLIRVRLYTSTGSRPAVCMAVVLKK